MCRLWASFERRKVIDGNDFPDLTSWGLDLEIHVCIPKVDPGLAVTGWDTILVSNGAEMLKLVIEHVRDISVDPVVAIPEEPGEAEDGLGSGADVKL